VLVVVEDADAVDPPRRASHVHVGGGTGRKVVDAGTERRVAVAARGVDNVATVVRIRNIPGDGRANCE
jgi:hypothetical protein